MRIRLSSGPVGYDTGRSLLVIGRWLGDSLILLLVGWFRFIFATRRGFVVGAALFALFAAANQAPGPPGSPAINELPAATVDTITVFELFFVAVGMRLASGFRDRAHRAGWIRFLGSWACAGLGLILVSSGVSELAAGGQYSGGSVQILGAAGVAAVLLSTGAITNWAALGKALAAERAHSTARRTRDRILTAVAKRPLSVPARGAYASWYAWAVCTHSASPAAAHRAAEAAISALRSGSDTGRAASAASWSRWTPAGVVDRFKSMAWPPSQRFSS